jgi:hypothetical protein
LNTRFYQGALPDEVWLTGDLELLDRCDAVLLVSGWERSVGTKAEIRHAETSGIEIFRDLESLGDWIHQHTAAQ